MPELKENYSYPNPPISEVAWEIKYQPILNFEKNLDEFLSLMEGEYPIIKDMWLQGFNFSLGKETHAGVDERKKYGKELLSDEERNQIVRVSNESLSIMTRSHNTHEVFIETVRLVIEKFNESFNTEDFSPIRLGLRYINVIDIPNNDTTRLLEYVDVPFDFSKFPLSTLDGFNWVAVRSVKGYSLRTSIMTSVIKDEPKLIIDWDCYNEGNKGIKILLEKIIDQTTSLHKIIKEEFENIITEKFITDVMEMVK